MVSKSLLQLLGLKLNVYGLDEFKELPENTPLGAMFFCHGSYKTQEDLEYYCQKMCTLNENRLPGDRYLLIISIDHPNVGTRQSYKEELIPKPGSYQHQDFVLKMYLHSKSTARTIASIIECFDFYAFGVDSKSYVEKWGAIGHSMGGMTVELLPTFEPKISTVIIISSCLKIDIWLSDYPKSLGHDVSFYAPKMFHQMIETGTKDAVYNLRKTNMLLLNGEKDKFIQKPVIYETINEFRRTHIGREGHDWKWDILPGMKHPMSDAYIVEAIKWTNKWMISKSLSKETRLMSNL